MSDDARNENGNGNGATHDTPEPPKQPIASAGDVGSCLRALRELSDFLAVKRVHMAMQERRIEGMIRVVDHGRVIFGRETQEAVGKVLRETGDLEHEIGSQFYKTANRFPRGPK